MSLEALEDEGAAFGKRLHDVTEVLAEPASDRALNELNSWLETFRQLQ